MIRIIISSLLFGVSFLVDNPLIFLILSYIVISYEIFIDGIKNILKGELFDENTLMIIATIAAFLIGEYNEAIMVMLLFEIGEYLSDLAVDNSKKSITKLMDIRSDYINLKVNDKYIKKDIKEAKIGDIFAVKVGEKIPLDGIIIEGDSSLDTSSLTGESMPRSVKKGDEVLSGMVNERALIIVKATSDSITSTASKIIELIEKSNDKKTNTEKFITKFSKIYTPIVVVLAILITLIPTLLGYDFNTWIYKSLVFLVTSCPCALVISVPLGFFCGIGKASKEGILIKGSLELELLTKIKAIVFDKTGTLTKGNFEVTNINTKLDKQKFLKYMAYGENFSNHPIALSIKNAYNEVVDESKIKNFKEISGYGIKASIFKKDVLIGNDKLLKENNIKFEKPNEVGTIIYLVLNNEYQGYLVISDEIKDEAYDLVKNLNKVGINKVVMLSGDNEEIAKDVSKKLNIKEYYANLLPTDKVEKLSKIKENNITSFVGDGINDAPALKLSDLGIAMGGIGSDASIEMADIVLMHDNLNKIPEAIKIAKRTTKIVKFNIIFAIIFKLLMLILATLGYATIWMAVIADVGVTLLAVLNALRIMKKS